MLPFSGAAPMKKMNMLTAGEQTGNWRKGLAGSTPKRSPTLPGAFLSCLGKKESKEADRGGAERWPAPAPEPFPRLSIPIPGRNFTGGMMFVRIIRGDSPPALPGPHPARTW